MNIFIRTIGCSIIVGNIPQSFTNDNQKIKVVIDDTTYTAELNGTSWEAGKVVTYTISK